MPFKRLVSEFDQDFKTDLHFRGSVVVALEETKLDVNSVTCMSDDI
jgi:hypothetical protein